MLVINELPVFKYTLPKSLIGFEWQVTVPYPPLWCEVPYFRCRAG